MAQATIGAETPVSQILRVEVDPTIMVDQQPPVLIRRAAVVQILIGIMAPAVAGPAVLTLGVQVPHIVIPVRV